ncbi:hypothetical protein [Scleromatobacter humisilvae]|uniref:Uncharacterized protein n=1 Tax=Scleromatobacter humisilvae TaxID=2897159 RepID=A0A9X2C1L3_9BURK|nr:hypothetical protein [Scleromatobacter humisilvae]MCK9687676.1 hypothetical protein [Scleromatobacter humisilvae]
MPALLRLACAVLLGAAASLSLAQRAPLPESPRNPIEYASPGAALEALRADPAVRFETHEGWVVAHDDAKKAMWTFAPKGDPAWPAVAKRSLVERDGQVMISTAILCGASKAVCDEFVRKFVRLNQEMARAVQRQQAEASAASAP